MAAWPGVEVMTGGRLLVAATTTVHDCVATFSDDRKICKPRSQVHSTKQAAFTCSSVSGGFECVTGSLTIPLCKERGWEDASSAFAVRLPR